jgi:hypothetical protein
MQTVPASPMPESDLDVAASVAIVASMAASFGEESVSRCAESTEPTTDPSGASAPGLESRRVDASSGRDDVSRAPSGPSAPIMVSRPVEASRDELVGAAPQPTATIPNAASHEIRCMLTALRTAGRRNVPSLSIVCRWDGQIKSMIYASGIHRAMTLGQPRSSWPPSETPRTSA